MSDLQPDEDQLKFLRTFFGDGNTLRWKEFEDGQMAQNARDLLSTLATDFLDGKSAVTLPRVLENGRTDWYCCARNPRQSRMLREQLESFLGPSYTDFQGQRAVLDAKDSVELAVNTQFGSNVFKLRVLNGEHRNIVRDRIFLMRSLRDRVTGRGSEQVKPIGRLLRDLEMALFAKNEHNAWRIHEQLRARGRLSSRNLLFLQVIVLAAFEHWEQILALPQYPSLMNVRRPVRVSHALLKANYLVHFQSFEQANDVTGCVAAFSQRQPTFGTLFRSTGKATDDSVLKIQLLHAAANSDTGDCQLKELKAQYHASGVASTVWVEAISELAGKNSSPVSPVQPDPEPAAVPPKTVFEKAKHACDSNDFLTAMPLLLQCEPTVDVLRQTLACAFELNELESTSQTIEYVNNAPQLMRDEALAMRSAAQWYETLCKETGLPPTPSTDDDATETALPNNWHLWLNRINQTDDWPEAMDVLQLGMASWDVEVYRDDPAQLALFADALTASRSKTAEVTLRLAMPHLLTAFISDKQPTREFKDLYLSFALMLSLDDEIGSDDLNALATLTEAILESDPVTTDAKNEFQDLLEILEAAWSRIQSSRHLDWTLTVLDLLIAYNVSNRTPTDGYINAVVSSFRQWSGRVRIDQWDFLKQLFEELGQSELLTDIQPEESQEAETSEFDAQSLAGKSIAIYTLTERIGRQAQQMIQKRFEGVKVHLLHVKASTDRLVQLAQSADIFIVNTWDAKHAATGAIKQNRSKQQITLMPESKSAGSIFKCVFAQAVN